MRNALTYSRDEGKFALLLFLLLLFSLSAQAQQFSVSSFRTIPNDLTAFHTPVYDLNHDACALIKVVGDPRFVFDSPLGIVKRTDEVGEVWIYLPQGSVMLTIRHPEWGVLRDYRLAEPLVANITYELVLAPPVQVISTTIAEVVESTIEKTEEEEPVIEDLSTLDVAEKVTVKEKLYIMALAQVGIGAKSMAYGMRIGLLQKHGFYLMAEADFKSVPSTAGECDADGVVKGTSSAAYYSGEIKRSLKCVMGGGVHRLVGGLHIYEGLGYGSYEVVWGTSNGKYYKNVHDSVAGLSAEVGALYLLGKVAFSAGASTIMGKHWEANVGIGVCF